MREIRVGRWNRGFLCLIFFFFSALPKAEATQIHAAPEGLYAHQIAHVFFLVSMGILIYWLRERDLVRKKGWRLLQYAALCFFLWNLDAMFVHFMEGHGGFFEIVGKDQWTGRIVPKPGMTPYVWIYYLCKMDHLLCVPGIIFLHASLRHLHREAQAGVSGGRV